MPVGEVEGETNRLIERKVSELDGHKSLYSDAYYARDEFDELYGGATYRGREAAVRPRFTTARSLREGGATTMTSIKGQAPDTAQAPQEPKKTDAAAAPEAAGKLTLAEVLELFAGGRLPLRFTAYDGSSAGPPDARARHRAEDAAGHHLSRHRAGRSGAGARLHRR